MNSRCVFEKLRDRKGASLALVTVMLAGVMSVLALAIDLGMLYTARGEAQRTADAAALAGASALLVEDITTVEIQQAKSRAKETAARNYVRNQFVDTTLVASSFLVDTTTEAIVEVIPADDRVRVTVRREALPLWFARLFGRSVASVSAVATAWAAPADATGSGCILPLAGPDMWDKPPENEEYPNGIWDFEVGLGCQGNNCQPRELWQYRPEEGDWYDGDVHGFGSSERDGVEDYYGRSYTNDEGRRIPLKINHPSDGPEASFWFPWVIPGTGNGVSSLINNIYNCGAGDLQIGDILNPDGESGDAVKNQPGMFNKPVSDAIIDFIDGETGNPVIDDRADPDAVWNEELGGVDPETSRFGEDWRLSSRIVTIALFHPEDMGQGRTNMQIMDFVDVFLEDPRVNHTFINPRHHRPITGRILRFGLGGGGEQNRSRNLKYLRLVE